MTPRCLSGLALHPPDPHSSRLPRAPFYGFCQSTLHTTKSPFPTTKAPAAHCCRHASWTPQNPSQHLPLLAAAAAYHHTRLISPLIIAGSLWFPLVPSLLPSLATIGHCLWAVQLPLAPSSPSPLSGGRSFRVQTHWGTPCMGPFSDSWSS